MKYFWILILCVVASFTSVGQQTNPMFYKEILLIHKPYTLQSITEEMRAQSGISFSYNAASINPNTKIKIKGDRVTVAEILALIKKKTGISYKTISQRHIIYVASSGKRKPVSKTKKVRRPQNQSNNKTEAPLVVTEPVVPSSNSFEMSSRNMTKDSAEGALTIVGDSNLVMAYYSGGGGSGSGGGGGNDALSEEQEPPPHIPERKWRRGTASFGGGSSNNALNFFGNNILLALGLSIDETYYCNPTLKFGMRFLYGVASYNLGGGANTWRYGLGGSATIDEHWSMHFVVTTGQSVSKSYSIPSNDTTIPGTPLQATSKLTRYGISTNYNFGNGFAVEGGLTFNSLKTNYTSNGSPVTLSDILPVGYDADERYPGIKPPYVLGNSYSGNSTGNTKIWLGFQVTLLCQLRLSGE